jgi:phage shock protein C
MNRSAIDRLRERYFLDRRNGWLAGVCAGVARSLDTDPAFLRVAFVLAGLFVPKLAIGAYLVAWILLDEREQR